MSSADPGALARETEKTVRDVGRRARRDIDRASAECLSAAEDYLIRRSRMTNAIMPAEAAPLARPVRNPRFQPIQDEYEYETAVLEAQEARIAFILHQIEDLQKHGLLATTEVIRFAAGLDDGGNWAKPYGQLLRDAINAQLVQSADLNQKIVHLGARGLGLEIERSMRVPLEAKQKRGRVARLLFGEE